jgi:hypothetical protein
MTVEDFLKTSLNLPASSWRPPGGTKLSSKFHLTTILVVLYCVIMIHPVESHPLNEEGAVRSRSGGVVALPPHFRVDDPDESAFEADFGRRISRHNSNDDLQDQIVQASTQEEIKASRVRKRNFSTSVISERTIQIRDEDDENSLDRTETSKTIPPSTTSTTERSTSTVNAGQQLGLGSSRAVIRYVSTVPPAPFGTKPHSGSTGGLPVNPTSNPPGEDQRKVSIRTVLRRPPLRSQQTTRNQDSTARTTTTVRSEKSPSNTTLATHQLRTRVRIKETLLARVQGRLRARSTTETPQHTTIKDLTPSSTSTARDPTTIGRSTTMTPSTTTTLTQGTSLPRVSGRSSCPEVGGKPLKSALKSHVLVVINENL